MSSKWQIALRWTAFTLSSLLIIFFATQHSPWRDEAQAINLVTDSTSWGDLIHRTQYEGHPLLWFAIIKLIGAQAVPVVHTIIALLVNYLVIFKSKLSFGLQLTLPFSYYFLFEYAIIYRNYSIGILLLMLALVLWKKHLKLSFAFLLLATQANFFSALLSGFLLLLLFDEYKLFKNWKFIGISILVYLAFFFQLLPPESGGFASETTLEWNRLTDALSSLGQSFFPIPNGIYICGSPYDTPLWNSSIFPNAVLIVGTLVTVVLLGATLPKKSRVLFASAVIIIVLFGTLKLHGFARHYGHVWIFFLLLLWKAENRIALAPRIWIFTLVLIHCSVGLYFGILSSTNEIPFSQAENVGVYLEQKSIPAERVATYPDNFGTAISLTSGQAYYQPVRDTVMTHVIWDARSQVNLYPKQLKERLNAHFKSGTYYVATPFYLPDMHSVVFANAQLEEEWTEALTDEKYFLFKIEVEETL